MMKIVKLFLSVCILMATFSCGSANANDVNAEELRKMMSENTRLFVVDTRTEFEYRLGHIPKAINISQEKFYMLDSLLPAEKDTPIVFYCRGVG
jgi:rhodanese-related sulfurtransferase